MLDHIIKVKTSNDLGGIYIVYKYGPQYDLSRGTPGLSHILEHMMCESVNHLSDEFVSRSITKNAVTRDDSVVFYITGLCSQLKEFADEYINRITSYVPNIKDFAKQIKIIRQEYRNFLGDEVSNTYTSSLAVCFGMQTQIGSKSFIENVTFNDAQKAFDEVFRHPTNIIIAGDDDFIESAERVYSGDFSDPKLPESYQYNNEADPSIPVNENQDTFFMISNPVIKSVSNNQTYYLEVLSRMLSTGLGSPIKQELREKRQLIYSNYCFPVNIFNDDMKSLELIFQSDPKNGEEIKTIMKEILSDPDNYLSEDRYNIAIGKLTCEKEIDQNYKHTLDYIDSMYLSNPATEVMRNLEIMSYSEFRVFYDQWINPKFCGKWQFGSYSRIRDAVHGMKYEQPKITDQI